MEISWFTVAATISIFVLGFLLFLALFEPGLAYKISAAPPASLDSPDFLRILEALTDSKVNSCTHVEVLTNGEIYYEAELQALREARRSINLEAYIFQKGEVTRRFLEVLTERARAGVEVRLVLDWVGSFASWNSYFKELTDAGGRVRWYHPPNWKTIARFNNRTHRELIVVDGRVGFVGGSGFADHWLVGRKGHPRWRDTMFRVEGDAVASLQGTFAENWLESSGEILSGGDFFPFCEATSRASALVVNSSPSAGRSTHARMLYQTLLASARKSVLITTPYFLPDWSARQEMVRAIRERGVEIEIITPGPKTDHTITYRTSRRLYGDLLAAGAKIYEYQAAMVHAKTLVVDGVWSVVGSTNFDNRSFGLNDEVNLAVFDPELAARIAKDFARDRADARAVTHGEWRGRSLFERLHEQLGRLFERQQ
ncbi:MAG TPA: phospholipase D-like domain-containing protein [Pyrinomonadaceae bacterium]|nr:phospholipase D-like domain-containing protein [Pyrinomonadaceae bacterium]